ncbi:MAG: response regulator [Silvanigrellales bacterium]|nr:response regulator [Silvanigrellales bacterium]
MSTEVSSGLGSNKPSPLSDVERLLHELQVHQIELEMQNAELRRTQVELEVSRNKFSNLYDFSPIGYFSIARDTVILEVNLHGSQMLDVPRSEVAGKPFYVFVSPEYRRIFYNHVEDVFLHGAQSSSEILLQCRGRRLLWARLDSILSGGEGALEPHCRTSVIDITQQKVAEAHVATMAQAVDQSLDAIAVVDSQGLCEQANPHFLDLVGLSLERLRGKAVMGVLSQATSLRSAHLPDELFHAGEHHRFTLHVARASQAPFSPERWYDVRVSPVLDPRGRISNYVLTFSDVSELRTAMRELTRAKERAESANSAKSQFLANMSHELRTPMNSVLGFSELLLAEEDNEQKKWRLEAVSSAGKMLLTLLDDLLDLSRVEVGKLPLHQAPFDVRKLLIDAQLSFELKVRAKGLSFFVRVDDGVPSQLVGDEIRILQIVSNLANNAVKFTREGFVSVECGWHKGLLTFQVSDTGIGIPESSLESVFLPFEQDDPTSTREHQGSGLGLAIVKRLVEAMRGEVTLKSQVGVGTSVSVSLPLQTQSEPTTLSTSPMRSRALRVFDEAEGARVRVLLADDCPMNRKLMTELLLRAGLRCDSVGDGEEAIMALFARHYDILLLDMQMPRKDGFEVLQEVEQQRSRKEPVPWVVSVTAHALKGDEERMLRAGADAYLSKPVGIVSFMEALSTFRKHRPEVGKLPIL